MCSKRGCAINHNLPRSIVVVRFPKTNVAKKSNMKVKKQYNRKCCEQALSSRVRPTMMTNQIPLPPLQCPYNNPIAILPISFPNLPELTQNKEWVGWMVV